MQNGSAHIFAAFERGPESVELLVGDGPVLVAVRPPDEAPRLVLLHPPAHLLDHPHQLLGGDRPVMVSVDQGEGLQVSIILLTSILILQSSTKVHCVMIHLLQANVRTIIGVKQSILNKFII